MAGVRPTLEKYFEEMSMDAYWEIFPSVAEARAFFARRKPS